MTTTRPRRQRATTRAPFTRRLTHRRRPARPDRSLGAARRSRLTGERPRRGATPRSLLALHDAGYRAVLERLERLGPGRVLDVGCGEGFESLHLGGGGRQVLGVDYATEATEAARRLAHDRAAGSGSAPAPAPALSPAFAVAQMDAVALGLADGTFDAVCSSHLIEHFSDPSAHVAELARVVALTGTAFLLTPNAPADFENPFHLRLFGPEDLGDLLRDYFAEVWVGGVDATDRVKADFAARRASAARLLRLDMLDLRHRIPRSWYVALYTRLLPVAYTLVARRRDDACDAYDDDAYDDDAYDDDAYRSTDDDWFVTDLVDETTMVLFAVCRRPRRRSQPLHDTSPSSLVEGPTAALVARHSKVRQGGYHEQS